MAELPQWIADAAKAKTNGHKTIGNGPNWQDARSSDWSNCPEVIKNGTRDDTLDKFGCSLRPYHLPFNMALVQMKDGWKRCEEPPPAKISYTWDMAVSKLKGAFGRRDGVTLRGIPQDRSRQEAPRRDDLCRLRNSPIPNRTAQDL